MSQHRTVAADVFLAEHAPGRMESRVTLPMLDHALRYAARGWPVLALAPGSKLPMRGTRGVLDASTDEATIRAWWRTEPRANVGVAGCASLAILDVDVKYGKRGDVTLVELIRDRGPMGWTLQASTPSGGSHFYFGIPGGVTVRPSVERLGPGLDVRGVGSYVVAPPSTIGGEPYRWVEDGAVLSQPSSWLLAAMVGTASVPNVSTPKSAPSFGRWGRDLEYRASRALAYVERCEPAISGAGGHAATFKVACVASRGFDLPTEIALEVLRHFNDFSCRPKWTERELRHKIADAEASSLPRGYLLERGAA